MPKAIGKALLYSRHMTTRILINYALIVITQAKRVLTLRTFVHKNTYYGGREIRLSIKHFQAQKYIIKICGENAWKQFQRQKGTM